MSMCPCKKRAHFSDKSSYVKNNACYVFRQNLKCEKQKR